MIYFILSLVMAAGSTIVAAQEDPYLWLEEVESERSLNWVRERSEPTLARLHGNPVYKQIESETRTILSAKDRIPEGTLRGGWVYNFWQDQDHPRGIWRRTRPTEYSKPSPKWEIILDVDALSKKEGKHWVFHGTDCLPTNDSLCLIDLSNGGKDASEVREFDIDRKEFVKDGFFLPEAKSKFYWVDENTLLIGTNFGEGSLTTSGYPRFVKLWKRGEPLSSAQTIFEGKTEDMSAHGQTVFRPEGKWVVISRRPSFFTEENWIWSKEKRQNKNTLPVTTALGGIFQGKIFGFLREEWTVAEQRFPEGSIVTLPLDHLAAKAAELVFAPDTHQAVQGLSFSKSAALLVVLENVRSKVLKLTLDSTGKWVSSAVPLPDMGAIRISSVNAFENEVFAVFESFLTPTTLYSFDSNALTTPRRLHALPPRFDASPYEVHQLWTRSADGTQIPYFWVGKKGQLHAGQGKTPVILNGYGGFEIPKLPLYIGALGKVWLERGGAYAVANIRGGGEFGPRWHRAALTLNRHKAFEDFIAVSEDLITRKITSPRHLGIVGGSNGGLLMGVMLTKRPDLYQAIQIGVPLLDMLRYHRLLAGASWMEEYGNPEIPEHREYLKTYSPYQNVRPGKPYPEVLIMTSTKDDRVHPGHARKMAAKLEETGYPFLYFENIDGGHAGSASLDELVRDRSLGWTYFYERLF